MRVNIEALPIGALSWYLQYLLLQKQIESHKYCSALWKIAEKYGSDPSTFKLFLQSLQMRQVRDVCSRTEKETDRLTERLICDPSYSY